MKTLVTFVVIAVIGLPTLVVATRQRSNQESKPRQSGVGMLARVGTLHDAAVAAGGQYFQVIDGDPHPPATSVRVLTSRSDAVLVGEVVENRCHLTPDEIMAATTYRVKVLEVLAARRTPRPRTLQDAEILVTVVGGRVEFPDGTVGQTSTRYFRRPVNGERYLFFLSENQQVAESISAWAGNAPAYSLLLGSNGVFGIPATGDQIEPRGRAGEHITRNTAGRKTVAAVLAEARASSAEVAAGRRER